MIVQISLRKWFKHNIDDIFNASLKNSRPKTFNLNLFNFLIFPEQVFKPLVDRVEIFKTKKLPVEFLSDNKLVFQEYSHLRTITVSIWMNIMKILIEIVLTTCEDNPDDNMVTTMVMPIIFDNCDDT